MKIINLTPHDINLHMGDEVVTFPKSRRILRVETLKSRVETDLPYPIIETSFLENCIVEIYSDEGHFEGEYTWNDDLLKGDYFLVSSIVKNHPSFKEDSRFLVPSSPVRNENGQTVGCKEFSI